MGLFRFTEEKKYNDLSHVKNRMDQLRDLEKSTIFYGSGIVFDTIFTAPIRGNSCSGIIVDW